MTTNELKMTREGDSSYRITDGRLTVTLSKSWTRTEGHGWYVALVRDLGTPNYRRLAGGFRKTKRDAAPLAASIWAGRASYDKAP